MATFSDIFSWGIWKQYFHLQIILPFFKKSIVKYEQQQAPV